MKKLLLKILAGVVGLWAFLIVIFSIPHDSTIYAKNFDSAKFQSVKTGDSKNTVRALLGEPLSSSEFGKGQEVWFYSYDGGGGWGLGRYNFFNKVEFSGDRVSATRVEKFYE